MGKTGIQWGSSIREAGVETFPYLDRSEVTGVSSSGGVTGVECGVSFVPSRCLILGLGCGS